MKATERVCWVILGHIAEMVHNYEGPVDAVSIPFTGILISFGLFYAGFSISTSAWIGELLTVTWLGLGFLLMVLSLMSVAASVVYATQETEFGPADPSADRL